MIVSRVILIVVLLALVATPLLAQTDDPFLRRFADGGEVEPTALARFMFGLASSLENGKRSVQLLLDDRDRGGYRRYAEALKQFHQAAESLADRPESSAARFRALAAGHEACWRLDRQISLAEAYGVSGSELRSVISSGTACNKFRRVAFDARVIDALAERLDAADTTNEELIELEQLLEDLRQIDEQD